MRTASVTVNWGSPTDTLLALSSLAAMDRPPDHIICVDNGSSPEDLAKLRDGAPDGAVLLELDDNLGPAAANNAGMAYAVEQGVDWTLILNNDATVSRECMDRCLDEGLSGDGVAVVGPAITFADRPDVLWYAGGRVSDWFAVPRHRGLLDPASATPPTSDTGYVPFCCALLSTTAWKAVGDCRTDYFMYYEDTEWCQRATAAGWRCRYLGEVLCAHAVSASGGQRGSLGLTENMAYYLARNPLRFAIESDDVLHRVTRSTGLLTVYASFNAWRTWKARQPRIGAAYMRGLRDAVTGSMGPRPAG